MTYDTIMDCIINNMSWLAAIRDRIVQLENLSNSFVDLCISIKL